MKKMLRRALPLFDILLAPFLFPSAWIMKAVRKMGIQNLPVCKHILLNVGVFPIQDHYYEPQFNHASLKDPLNRDRILAGIRWNSHEQLALLDSLTYADELSDMPQEKPAKIDVTDRSPSWSGIVKTSVIAEENDWFCLLDWAPGARLSE